MWLSVVTIKTYAHISLTALCLGLPSCASIRKVKPIWILLKQETVSSSGISWDICKSAPCSKQITMPTPHLSFLQAGCPSCRPTVSKHWRQFVLPMLTHDIVCQLAVLLICSLSSLWTYRQGTCKDSKESTARVLLAWNPWLCDPICLSLIHIWRCRRRG